MSQQIAPGMKLVTKANTVVTVKSISDRGDAATVEIASMGSKPDREELWDLDKTRAGIRSGDYRVVIDQTAVMA